MRESEQGGQEVIYIGRASRDPEPDEDKKLSIEGALRHAYQEAGKPGRYRVLWTEIEGTNPISDYIVAIGTSG